MTDQNSSEAPKDRPVNATPGYKNYLVYCDESGTDGAEYYGFGSLWMPWERRGDFHNIITTLRSAHSFTNELKWKKVGPRNFEFCKALVGEFFRRQWLMFHCMLIRKGYVDKQFHGSNPYDVARRKHFAKLLESKIQYFSNKDEKKPITPSLIRLLPATAKLARQLTR